MKLTPWKMMACAATALMAAGAHATGPGYALTSGSADLTFTTDSLAALNAAGISIAATPPATFDGSKISLSSNNSLTSWDASYNLTSMAGLGGFVLSSSTTPGAKITISNVTLDLNAQTVYADLVTNSFTSAFGNYTGQTYDHMAMFSGTLVGDRNIVSAGGTPSPTLKDLFLVSSAIPAMGNALGVPTFIQNAVFPTLNFGSIAVKTQFTATPPVPEPSVSALAIVGLAGVGAFVRRRQRAA